MTGVTHGADAARLRDIATTMRGQGQRIQEMGDELVPLAAMLQAAWGGPDAEHLLTQVEGLRPTIAGTGATLVAWAEELRGQADQQAAGSGEGGGAGGSGAPGGASGGNPFAGLSSSGSARAGGGRLAGGSPLLAGEGGLPLTNAIGDGPQTDPGEKRQPGSVSNSDTKEAGKVIKGQVTATETVDVSKEFVDSEGRSVQTTTVSARVEAGVGGEAGGKGTGGSFGAGGGTEVSYEVTAPVGVDPMSIDPNDPASWPPGTSVRFGEEYFAAFEAEARFRGIIANAGYEFGTEAYVEVSKGSGDQVVVQVGDAEFLRASSELGVGTPDLNIKAGASSETSSGTAREVTIDLSTAQGRQAFEDVMNGEPASADAPGVVDIADLTIFNASQSMGVSGTAGDFSAGGTLAEWNSGGVQRTHADGTTTLEWSGLKSGTQVGGIATFDANGEMIEGKSTYYLRMEGVSPEAAAEYNKFYLGENTAPAHDNNVVLNFTHGDISQMKTQAAQTQAAMINANPGYYHDFPGASDGNVTASDVLRHCENNPDAVIDLGGPNSATQVILTSGSDAEVLRAMMATGGPLEFQNELAVDYYTAKGERIDPVGDVTSQRSA